MAWSIGKKLSPILEIYFVFKIFTIFSEAQIGTIFGAITVASGIVGVLTGAVASNNILKPREGPSADATVCGLSMIISAVFVYLALVFLEVNIHTIKHYHSSLITLFLFLFFLERHVAQLDIYFYGNRFPMLLLGAYFRNHPQCDSTNETSNRSSIPVDSIPFIW